MRVAFRYGTLAVRPCRDVASSDKDCQQGRPPCTLQLEIAFLFVAHTLTLPLVTDKSLRFAAPTAARHILSSGLTPATKGCTSLHRTPSFTTTTTRPPLGRPSVVAASVALWNQERVTVEHARPASWRLRAKDLGPWRQGLAMASLRRDPSTGDTP